MISHAEVEQTACSNSSWAIYGLTVVVALLFSALICCTLYRVNVSMMFTCQSKAESQLSE